VSLLKMKVLLRSCELVKLPGSKMPNSSLLVQLLTLSCWPGSGLRAVLMGGQLLRQEGRVGGAEQRAVSQVVVHLMQSLGE
jgi:hypothetical protein